MAKDIKSGFIGILIGAVLTFGTIALTTGAYKQKVDDNCHKISSVDARLNITEGDVRVLSSQVATADAMLMEVRSDVKELLKRTE